MSADRRLPLASSLPLIWIIFQVIIYFHISPIHQPPVRTATNLLYHSYRAMTICLAKSLYATIFRGFARVRISPIPPTGDKAPVLTPLPMFIPPCYIIACFYIPTSFPSSLTQLTVSQYQQYPVLESFL